MTSSSLLTSFFREFVDRGLGLRRPCHVGLRSSTDRIGGRNGQGGTVELWVMRFLIASLLLAVLVAGCSRAVSGSGTVASAPPTTTTTTTTVAPESPVTPPPTVVDESAPAQY